MSGLLFMLDGPFRNATLHCCVGSCFVPGVSEKPLSLSCVLHILLLHIVLCEILNEREDFFCTELTLSFWSVLVCCSFEW